MDAQDGTFDTARSEIARGRKTSHWMWFIYPQLRGLGRSGMADYYGIENLDEAEAYLAHPVLGPRLVGMAELVLTHRGTPPEAIFGGIDAAKLRSCATLFAAVPGAPPVFAKLLDAFYDGPCLRTTARLAP